MAITTETYRTLKFDDLMNWCKETKNTKAAKWLVDKIPALEVKEITYLALKREFCLAFIPNAVPERKASNTVSMPDKLKAFKEELGL